MQTDIKIERRESESKVRYEARVAGRDGIGELTYSRVSPTRVIADNTEVDEELRGMGVGKALVDRLVEDARSEGFEILPECSFVKHQYQQHPEWSDVMHA